LKGFGLKSALIVPTELKGVAVNFETRNKQAIISQYYSDQNYSIEILPGICNHFLVSNLFVVLDCAIAMLWCILLIPWDSSGNNTFIISLGLATINLFSSGLKPAPSTWGNSTQIDESGIYWNIKKLC
jgi:hypothetical protein